MVIQALYYPISKGDRGQVSGIVNAAKRYYSKLALYYSGTMLAVSIVLPFVLKVYLTWWEISTYFLVFGVSNIVNFMVTAAYRPLLIADGRNYVNSNIGMVFHFVLQAAKIIMLSLTLNIVIIQAVYSTINIIQIVVYLIYFKKNYNWLDKKAEPLMGKLKQRGAFFVQQVCNLVFSCTDVLIISIFCDLKTASVYAVYMLIYNAISILLSNVSSSTQFILGQTYAEGDKGKYLKTHRAYENVLVTVSSILFTSASMLTIPFLKIYTHGITDANYIDWLLPIMFSANGILSTYKSVSLCLINVSFNAKNNVKQTLTEAGINLCLTLILVPMYGIRGALIGTGVALIYRVIDLLFIANHRILKDSIKKPLVLYSSNTAIFIILSFVGLMINIDIRSYFSLAQYACILALLVTVLYVGLNLLLDIRQSKMIFNYVKIKIEKYIIKG